MPDTTTITIRISRELLEKIDKKARSEGKSRNEIIIEALSNSIEIDIDSLVMKYMEENKQLDEAKRKVAKLIAETSRLKMYKKYLKEEIEKLEWKIAYRKQALKVLYKLQDYVNQLELLLQIPEAIGEGVSKEEIRGIIKQLRTIYKYLIYHLEVLTAILRKKAKAKEKVLKQESTIIQKAIMEMEKREKQRT